MKKYNKRLLCGLSLIIGAIGIFLDFKGDFLLCVFGGYFGGYFLPDAIEEFFQ